TPSTGLGGKFELRPPVGANHVLRFGTDVRLDAGTMYEDAYSDSVVRGSGASATLDGFAPAQSPRHAASATLAYEPRSGPALSTTLRYVARQFEDDLETDALPAALTVDAVARLPLGGGFTLIGRAENLFDETIVTRNVAGSMDLGTPRTFWIGVRFGL
ncbi:MAG: hypothetical protein ACT6QX_20400, partial [Sphingopyxis sp.]